MNECEACGHSRESHRENGTCHWGQHGALRGCPCNQYKEGAEELHQAIEKQIFMLSPGIYHDWETGDPYHVITTAHHYETNEWFVIAVAIEGERRVAIPATIFFKDMSRGGIPRKHRFSRR
jgi:hypothetical protein